MRLPPPILAGSIAVAVFAGGFAVGHFATEDSGSSKKASGKPQVLGQVFATNPDASTSTTQATLAPVTTPTQAPSPATTPTTAKPATGQATATVTQTQTTSPPGSPPATTTVVLANPSCGTGTADASLSSNTGPRTNSASTDYQTNASVTVHNGIDKAIQIDSLVIRIVYQDGGTQDVVFNNAQGAVLQPGASSTYNVSITTQRPVDRTQMKSFTFHTDGHPECPGHPA
jgi:hypothetical protein